VQLPNSLYDAKLDHQPVVAIVGQQKRASLGADWLQEVDLHKLLQDVGKYLETCMAPEQARHLIDHAMRVTKLVDPANLRRTRPPSDPTTRAGAHQRPRAERHSEQMG